MSQARAKTDFEWTDQDIKLLLKYINEHENKKASKARGDYPGLLAYLKTNSVKEQAAKLCIEVLEDKTRDLVKHYNKDKLPSKQWNRLDLWKRGSDMLDLPDKFSSDLEVGEGGESSESEAGEPSANAREHNPQEDAPETPPSKRKFRTLTHTTEKATNSEGEEQSMNAEDDLQVRPATYRALDEDSPEYIPLERRSSKRQKKANNKADTTESQTIRDRSSPTTNAFARRLRHRGCVREPDVYEADSQPQKIVKLALPLSTASSGLSTSVAASNIDNGGAHEDSSDVIVTKKAPDTHILETETSDIPTEQERVHLNIICHDASEDLPGGTIGDLSPRFRGPTDAPYATEPSVTSEGIFSLYKKIRDAVNNGLRFFGISPEQPMLIKVRDWDDDLQQLMKEVFGDTITPAQLAYELTYTALQRPLPLSFCLRSLVAAGVKDWAMEMEPLGRAFMCPSDSAEGRALSHMLSVVEHRCESI